MGKLKKHLQDPRYAPPTPEWDLTSAVCGFACGAKHLVPTREEATCKRCRKTAGEHACQQFARAMFVLGLTAAIDRLSPAGLAEVG